MMTGLQPRDVDAVVDLGAGRKRMHYRSDGLMPTITASRGAARAFWLTSAGRRVLSLLGLNLNRSEGGRVV